MLVIIIIDIVNLGNDIRIVGEDCFIVFEVLDDDVFFGCVFLWVGVGNDMVGSFGVVDGVFN